MNSIKICLISTWKELASMHLLLKKFLGINCITSLFFNLSRLIAAQESQKIAEELEQATLDSNSENLIECYLILLEEAQAIQDQLCKASKKNLPVINFKKQGNTFRRFPPHY